MARTCFSNLSALFVLLGVACTPVHVRERRALETAEVARAAVLESLPDDDEQALRGLERLARDAATPAVAARSAVRAGDRHLDAGRGRDATLWWHVATRLDPHGGWARAAVERLHASWAELPIPEREVRLRGLRHPALDGMLLYLAAADHAAVAEGRKRAVELCLLARRTASRSSYRDDCEDLVLSLLNRGDRIRFAEDLLLPLPSDDPAAMDGPRFQRIVLELAHDLAAAGRTDEAARRLRQVVDRYPSMRLKDDALWSLAKLYRDDGDIEMERSTLETLLENLPHSRFREEAEARLSELKK